MTVVIVAGRGTHMGLTKRTRAACALAALGAAAFGATTVTAQPAPTGFVATSDCAEHQAFVEGDDGAVAARLPKRYTALRDPGTGHPLIFVRALRCADVAGDGRNGPVKMASYGIVLESPDGSGCASGAPAAGQAKGDVPPVCNWYVLAWLADSPRIADWLRRGTRTFPAFDVSRIVFDLGDADAAQGGAPLHVEAPAPGDFTMDEIGRARPGALAVRGSYYNDTPDGTVRVRFSTGDLTSGDATGTVRAAPGSELAKLMGATERPYAAGYSSIAAEHWRHSAYSKQVQTPGGFAGDCSVKGTSKFDPPATNADAALTYDYSASGTCTGTLNGRSVTNAPVTVHHA